MGCVSKSIWVLHKEWLDEDALIEDQMSIRLLREPNVDLASPTLQDVRSAMLQVCHDEEEPLLTLAYENTLPKSELWIADWMHKIQENLQDGSSDVRLKENDSRSCSLQVHLKMMRFAES